MAEEARSMFASIITDVMKRAHPDFVSAGHDKHMIDAVEKSWKERIASINGHVPPQVDGPSSEPVIPSLLIPSVSVDEASPSTTSLLRKGPPQYDGAGSDDGDSVGILDDDDDDDDDDDGLGQITEPPAGPGSDILDDVSDFEEASKTSNMILCQFQKVSHVKGRWKATLSSGLVHVRNQDFVFCDGRGEFEFN